MGRIKSAWEIALEKTQDIQVDQAKYLSDKLEKEGMALAGGYLNSTDQTPDVLAAKYAAYSDQDRQTVRKGVINTIFSNLNLPTDDMYQFRFGRTCELVSLVAQGDMQAVGLMQQIGSFFQQYIECKKDFVDRMQEQIKQAMQNNPENFNSAQYTQMIQQNLKKMDAQYSGALDNTKETLRQLLG